MAALSSKPSAIALTPGARFHGRYEVVRCIAAGGMGSVYEVVHLETQRRRALKVMLPELVLDAEMRARFRLEATVAAEVQSEHIVETFDAGVDEATQTPFIVMELLRGEELADVLARRGPLPAEEVVPWLAQAALALDRTHAAGVVHRDLKPENLFLTERDDGTPRLKILDFGVAKVVARGAEQAKSTRGMGTPLYMSPEQVQGDGAITPAADLYAIGHIAYTLLVGAPYWDEEAQRAESLYPLFARILLGAPEAASARAARRGVTLPAAFDEWFACATAVDPAARPSPASRLVEALGDALGVAAPRSTVRSVRVVAAPDASGTAATLARPIDAATPALPMATTPPPAPSRAPFVAVGAVAFAIAVLVGTIVMRPTPAERAPAIAPPSASASAAPAPAAPASAAPSAVEPVVAPIASAAPTASAAASAARPPASPPPGGPWPARTPGAAPTSAPATTTAPAPRPPKDDGDPLDVR